MLSMGIYYRIIIINIELFSIVKVKTKDRCADFSTCSGHEIGAIVAAVSAKPQSRSTGAARLMRQARWTARCHIRMIQFWSIELITESNNTYGTSR